MSPAAPGPGDPAPPFTLPDADGRPVSLSDFAGRSVILYAYPAAGTPGCTAEACDFRDATADLDTAGYVVLGLSPDPPTSLDAFRRKEGLGFPLLSDPEHTVLEAYGAWGEKTMYGRTSMGVIRSTFLIGPDGRVEQAWRNVKASGHVARVLKDLGVAA